MARLHLVHALAASALILAGCSAPAAIPSDAAPTGTYSLRAPMLAAGDTGRTPGIPYPDPVMTPGDAFPDATAAEICTPGYPARVRDVPTSLKESVYAAYGITRKRLPNEFEMDHLIPLELGGSNDRKNLWPEAAAPKPGFHEKDRLENRLHDLVCAGQLDLRGAQDAIALDWYAAYLQYIGTH